MDTLAMQHIVKARKTHKCDYCNKDILKGEEYSKGTYKDDFVYDWKFCSRCEPYVREAFSNKEYDRPDGMGEQDFHDYMWEEHREVAKSWWN